MLEIQSNLLELYKEFSAICDRNGITYYACGGTALGAVRHNGFIPWDDDLDLTISRNDFNKIFIEKTIELPDYFMAEIDAISLSGKLMDKRIRISHGNDKWDSFTPYLSIEILPLDGTPNNPFFRTLHYYRVMMAFAKIKIKNLDFIAEIEDLKNRKRKSFIEKTIIKNGKFLAGFFKKNSNEKLVDRYNSLSGKYPIENSKKVCIFCGRYRKKEMMDKTVIGEGATIQFEDTQIRVYEKVELYLRNIYGNDYHLIPAENNHEKHGNLIIENNKA